jgi:integrase
LDALADQPLWARWLFVIALTAGPRAGEPVAAKKDWYDPIGFIDVPKSATKKNKYHVIPLIEILREPLARSMHERNTSAKRKFYCSRFDCSDGGWTAGIDLAAAGLGLCIG